MTPVQKEREAVPLSPAVRNMGIAGGFTMLAIGTLAIAKPELAAQSYGVPVTGTSDRAYMTAAGTRDLFVGSLALVFSLLGDRRALGITAALGSGIAVGDGIIALRNGPNPKKVLPTHWGSAIACIAASIVLLKKQA